jgi:diguanylate cyclase
LAAIVAVTVAAELLVMLALGQVAGWSKPLRLALLDAVVLALIIAPPTYFLILIPLRREFEMRLDAERRAATAARLAVTDPLTEALNRRGIKARLLEAMAQADRYQRPLSVAMLDLDGFKQINDRYGHTAGDEALCQVVAAVRRTLRTPDWLGRYGGDEFLLVLPETTLPAARALSTRIREVLSGTDLVADGRRLHLSASIGEVEFERGEALEALLERVDRALLEVKRGA